MREALRSCRRIQEDIACNRGLSQEDQQHVLSCSSCSEVAAKVAELDSLVRHVMDREILPGFADRVMAEIWEDEGHGDILSSWRFPLLERIFYSRAFQWLLVGIGSVLGLIKMFKFFSVISVHGFI
jgi:hypothetical protein